MPQATPMERRWAIAKFGDIDTGPIIEWLEKQGFKLRKDWRWQAPAGREPTQEEIRAVCFLVDEWDFGGIVQTEGI